MIGCLSFSPYFRLAISLLMTSLTSTKGSVPSTIRGGVSVALCM